MAAGVPILTSSRSALPEVAGDAALLVDPFDTEGLAQALKRLTGDGTLRQELARMGQARVREFSWEKAVDETWTVYRNL
jgi:glycosyltransferase involved in cell wall biosynthesis